MTRGKTELKDLMLASPPLTLAAAESLTCGRVQARVGEISGASLFFRGGLTAYTLDEKVRHLGVNRAAARRVNAVSAEVAAQMARVEPVGVPTLLLCKGLLKAASECKHSSGRKGHAALNR
jgi:hypothetical protein